MKFRAMTTRRVEQGKFVTCSIIKIGSILIILYRYLTIISLIFQCVGALRARCSRNSTIHDEVGGGQGSHHRVPQDLSSQAIGLSGTVETAGGPGGHKRLSAIKHPCEFLASS